MTYKKLNSGSRSSLLSKPLGSMLVCLLALWIFKAPPVSALAGSVVST